MFNVSGRPSATPSRLPLAVSLTLHVAAASALVYLTQTASHPPRPLFQPPKSSLVYIPVVPIEIPVVKLAELRAPDPVPAEEPAPPRPMPDVAPVFESRRAELARAIELPVEPPPLPPPPPPAPRPAEVNVGTFSNPAPVARTPEPARQIEIAGFDRVANQKVEAKPATTSVGAFDRSVAGNTQPGASPQTVVADSGFNRSTVVASSAQEGKVVRETGFGNTNSREKPRAAEPQAQVAPVMFETAASTQRTAAASPPPPPRITPVEVLSKPSPIYTEEARKLRIEGDVVLEVEFGATGTITVVRVVAGLGHGLDEAAVNAAKLIRFKPAEDRGRPVDFRTTVHIVFRLA